MGQRHWHGGSFQSPLFPNGWQRPCAPPKSVPPSLPHTHPSISPTTSNSPLIFVLSELSGLVATSLRNFPQPQELLSSPGIVVERQKAAWLSRLLLSEYRLALGVQGSLCPFLHPAPNNSPPDYEGFRAKILTFSTLSASQAECLAQRRLPILIN